MRDQDQRPVRAGARARLGARLRPRRDLPKLAAVRWPVGWRCIGIAILIAALLTLAYESGRQDHEPGRAAPEAWDSVINTITKPAVAIGLASLLVLALASLLRRLMFEWLAVKPGPIYVQELSIASGVSDVDVAHLTTAFRARLMRLRLHAPTPVPGATAPHDFLAVLDGEHVDPRNVLGTAVSILRAAIPTHAYEVSVTLTQDVATPPAKPRLGVTAQVTRLPNEGLPVETAWAHSWDEAIEQAADMVTAAVLPRTRLSNRPPWSGWRRYPMPGLLVHHFERAQKLTSLRRYDEALDRYFQALKLDPKNVDLRLQKGFVEEKLGLYLDAVATYAAARRVADQTSKRLYDRRARRNRTASGNIARYRLAVLLGGVKFAHQWRKPDTNTMRDKQRQFLRGRLGSELEKLLEQHRLMPRSDDESPAAPASVIERGRLAALLDESAADGASDKDDRRYYELRRVLAELARSELRDLRREISRPRSRSSTLTALSVDLTSGWLGLRLQYVERRLAELEPGGMPVTGRENGWTARPEDTLARSAPPLRTWTEEYNAACLYALPLLVAEPLTADAAEDGARRGELAREAVDHLKKAMSSTVSWQVAQRRDWVLSEDPDLDGLRQCPQFKHFEAIYFPSSAPTPRRPPRASRWEHSRYTNRLLSETARRWETVWHGRRDLLASGIDPHVVIEWSKDEADAWHMVRCLANDYRHWRVRCDLIEQMKTWSAKYDFEELNVEVPRFAAENGQDHADEGPQDDNEVASVVDREVQRNEARLEDVAGRLVAMTGAQDHNGNGKTLAVRRQGTVPDRLRSQLRDRQPWSRTASALRLERSRQNQLERLQDELRDRDFWHRAAPRLYLPSVCDVHAAMWQRLHEWLEELSADDPTPGSEFACAVTQAARLSSTFHGLWVVALLDRRVRRP